MNIIPRPSSATYLPPHHGLLLSAVLLLAALFTAEPVLAQQDTSGVRRAVLQETHLAKQRARLARRAEALRAQHVAERKSALDLVRRLGLPSRITRPGGVAEVQRVAYGLPVYFETLNESEAESISASLLWEDAGAGYHLSGAGITVGVWDGGAVRHDHQELAGRVDQPDAASTLSNHATHVSGTIGAAGVKEGARGIAYEASLQAYSMTSDRAEMATAAAGGLRVSNHSYGQQLGWIKNMRGDGRWGWIGDTNVDPGEDYRFGMYDWMARTWDEIAHDAPYYLIVKAAGNDRGRGAEPGEEHWVLDRTAYQWVLSTDVRQKDGGEDGFDTVLDAGNAKNVLTVGAVNDVVGGYQRPGDVVMTDFSAWGPTDDGRIKPDLVTDGVSVYSARSSAIDAYGRSSGTSMAAPGATGAVALLLEHERDLYGNAAFLASTYKTLLIHSADEAGPAQGPDYQCGWGLLNAFRAAEIMTADVAEGANAHIREHVLATGETFTWDLEATGEAPLRVTVGWSDPAGPESARQLDPAQSRLVHDLDLVVTGPDGTHYPWVLDPAQPSSPATRGVNTRDNVEQVLIEAPEAGTYRVAVTFKAGAGKAASTQAVSIVATGYGAEGALPVELTSFETVPDGDRLLLAWSTASETNNLGFGVELRAEADADWTRLAFVEGHGTTAQPRTYSYRTAPLAPGHYRVRLRQVDADGGVTLSEAVEVEVAMDGLRLTEIAPNPFRGQAELTLYPTRDEHVRASVYDLLGREVAVLHDGPARAGAALVLRLEGSRLAGGIYLVRVEGETFTETRRVVRL